MSASKEFVKKKLSALRKGRRSRAVYRKRATLVRAAARLGMRYGGYATKMAKEEKKFLDTASAVYGCDTTGSITLLSGVPQNASESGRIGREIYLRSLEGRGFVVVNNTTLQTTARLLVVFDRQPNKALPTVGDIITPIGTNGFMPDYNKKRFKVLKNIAYALDGNALTAGQGSESSVQIADFFLKFKKPLKCEFQGATGGIGDIISGSLLFVTVGSNAAGTAACSALIAFRLRYTEM